MTLIVPRTKLLALIDAMVTNNDRARQRESRAPLT